MTRITRIIVKRYKSGFTELRIYRGKRLRFYYPLRKNIFRLERAIQPYMFKSHPPRAVSITIMQLNTDP